MGVTNSLRSALTGLWATQRELDVVTNNIANADSAGYTRKTTTNTAIVAGGSTIGVRIAGIQRELDTQAQAQYRTAAAGQAYASVRSDSLSQLDTLIGGPGNSTSIDQLYSAAVKALQNLETSPDDPTVRKAAVNAFQTFTSQLNSLSDGVQQLRQQAEDGISSGVDEANGYLQQIQKLDAQVVALQAGNGDATSVMDQRDAAIDGLSKLMDIRVENQAYGAVAVYTTNGTLLYDDKAATLSFDAHGTITPDSQYSTDASQRTVGTVTLTGRNGQSVDLFAQNAFRSGSIVGYKSLRDEDLNDVQSQLDELAASFASALSDVRAEGTATTSGSQSGYTLDAGTMKQGNVFRVQVKDTSSGTTSTYSFVSTNSNMTPDNSYTPEAGDTVIGVDMSGGIGNLVSAIQSALGSGYSVNNPTGNQIEILDDGSGNNSVTSVTGRFTASSETSDAGSLPLLVDAGSGNSYYTGISPSGDQKRGFAQRVTVNSKVVNDPSLLVQYNSSVAAGDATRPAALLTSLTGTRFAYSANTGIGSASAPFTGTIGDYLKQVVSSQGANYQAAQSLKAGQDVVANNLQTRVDNSSKVNMDVEMSRLVELQTAYQANARVMTVAQEMLQTLMQM